MSTYTDDLQAELAALNARRAPLDALIAGAGFASLSEVEKTQHRFDSNTARARAEYLQTLIDCAVAGA